jgi:hypothetical protein
MVEPCLTQAARGSAGDLSRSNVHGVPSAIRGAVPSADELDYADYYACNEGYEMSVLNPNICAGPTAPARGGPDLCPVGHSRAAGQTW